MYYQFSKKSYGVYQTSKILKNLINLGRLPMELQNKENRRVIAYKFTNTIRNEILNYRDTVNSIYVED